MASITAVIITHNEERHIERCLQSLLGVVDEVLVLDSQSTDQTVAMAEALGARVIDTEWLGYAATKNKANALAANDWILSIDADEALSEELRQSILAAKNGLQGAYQFNRLNNYYGHWVRHGGFYPDKKLRLFNRKTARWVGDYVHETVALDGGVKITHLHGDLLHYTCANQQEHLAQIERFTDLAAQGLAAQGKKGSLLKGYAGLLFRFAKMYLLKLGLLDGNTGMHVAQYSAYAVLLREQKLIRLNEAQKA